MEYVNDSTQETGLAVADCPDGAGRTARPHGGAAPAGRAAAGGVQSIERAFDLLEMLADAGGALGLPNSRPSRGSRCPPCTG